MPISETIQRATLFAKLRRAAVFEGLSDAEMTRVAGCEIFRVAKGEVIFREGERVTGFYKILATELGTRRETLARLLGRLREDGVLEVRGRQIRILDTAGLRLRLDGRLKQMVGNSETTAP
jgi:CRP-like cAMP-binding protein